MVLIYSEISSSRLQYISQFIFAELFNTTVEITTDKGHFRNYDGVKINYSNAPVSDNDFHIHNNALLFEPGVKPQVIDCFKTNDYTAFFKTNQGNFPFDIFAASFYLLSRYEEYLPHSKDMYGRFAHEQSIAFTEVFLDLPLVNIWAADLMQSIKNKFAAFTYQTKPFKFIPTYDIDIAYSYQHKGLFRNVGGFLKAPSVERLKVLFNQQTDPFDSYDYLQRLHEKHKLDPIYFFLVAEKNGIYDKNILPSATALQALIKQQAATYTIGIHPSWQSGDEKTLLTKEKSWLEKVSGKTITRSRQHYIRFNLPEGYRRLIAAGISDDYTMGYGSINGFRASVANSFNWFDLGVNHSTNLRIHPFCFMEANSFYEQHLSADEAYNELVHYYTVCKKVNGQLITIWHNNFLGTDKKVGDWRRIYERFIEQVRD